HHTQPERAKYEAQMREKVESLQRIVTQSRTPAQNKASPREPDRSATANVVERRFHVSIAMDAPQVLDADRRGRRTRAMRKERRQGRIVFLILLAALGVAVMLLISHLHP